MTIEPQKQKARPAHSEFVLLLNWETFVSQLLLRTCRFPKVIRFTLTQRIENTAIEILENFVKARYRKIDRYQQLQTINLQFEKLRFLLRVAFARQACSGNQHEQLQRQLNDLGKQLGGWIRSEKRRETCRGES